MRNLVARGVMLIMMVAIGWSANPVSADTVTFHFTGTVTNINPPYIDAIGGSEVVGVGDQIAGSFTYDLDTPGTPGGTGPEGVVIRTDYFSPVPPGNMTYSVGGLTVTTEPGSEHFVTIVGNGLPSDFNHGESDVDTFIIVGNSSTPTALWSIFRLEDTSQSVYSATTLPTSFNLQDFDLRRFEVYKRDGIFGSLIFEASIDTIFASIADVGGSVTGVSPRRVICLNITTRQTVIIQNGAKSWNCEAAGLVVNPGDKILQKVLGRAD